MLGWTTMVLALGCIHESPAPERDPPAPATEPETDSGTGSVGTDSGTPTGTIGTDTGISTQTVEDVPPDGVLLPIQVLRVEGQPDACWGPLAFVVADGDRLMVNTTLFEREPDGRFVLRGCLDEPVGIRCPLWGDLRGDRAGYRIGGQLHLFDLQTLQPLESPDGGGQLLRPMDGRVVTEGPDILVYDEQPDGSWSSTVIARDEQIPAVERMSSAALRNGWFLLSRDYLPVRAWEEVDGTWVEHPTDYLQGLGALAPAVATDGSSVLTGQFADPVGWGWDSMPTTLRTLPPQVPASTGLTLRFNRVSYTTMHFAVEGAHVAQRRGVDPHVVLWRASADGGVEHEWLAMAEDADPYGYAVSTDFALTSTHLFVAAPYGDRVSVAVYDLEAPVANLDGVWTPPAPDIVEPCADPAD